MDLNQYKLSNKEFVFDHINIQFNKNLYIYYFVVRYLHNDYNIVIETTILYVRIVIVLILLLLWSEPIKYYNSIERRVNNVLISYD